MQLSLWNIITSATAQVRSLTEGSLSIVRPEKDVKNAGLTMIQMAGPDLLEQLRGKLKEHLAQLEAQLASHLTEAETYQVLLPLVIHCDEQVLRRLPIKDQPSWPLLQRERFQIDDGGDVFYQLIDERMQKSDTTVLVFEVLYFCLSDGFLGRFASDPTKIAAYKARLAARIPMPRMPQLSRRAHRKKQRSLRASSDGSDGQAQAASATSHSARASTATGAGAKSGAALGGASAGAAAARPGTSAYVPALHPAVLYVGTLLLIVLLPLVIVFLSNL